ncbi:MAG: hypothetical protein ACREFE_19450 [Limisphaerales bacterium]
MKVYTASAKEISERLELDKRRNEKAFCLCFKTLDEAPEGFYDLQDKIRDGLEKEFWAHFPDGEDRSPRPAWAPPSHEWFCFNTDMFGSERMVVEITKKILGDKLIGIILSFLEKSQSRYCVFIDVYDNMMKGSQYLGSIVITLDEIAIEETLGEIWKEQIQFLKIEEKR